MDVILLEKVDNLGDLGELVAVKSGYGRNYLIPEGKAVFATQENREKFEARRAELEKVAADALAAAIKRQEALLKLASVTLARKVGEEGKLFGSVGTADIAEAVAGEGIEIKKQEIRLPTGTIRQVGEYQIDIHLHPEVNARIQIVVEAETE